MKHSHWAPVSLRLCQLHAWMYTCFFGGGLRHFNCQFPLLYFSRLHGKSRLKTEHFFACESCFLSEKPWNLRSGLTTFLVWEAFDHKLPGLCPNLAAYAQYCWTSIVSIVWQETELGNAITNIIRSHQHLLPLRFTLCLARNAHNVPTLVHSSNGYVLVALPGVKKEEYFSRLMKDNVSLFSLHWTHLLKKKYVRWQKISNTILKSHGYIFLPTLSSYFKWH